MNFPSAVVVVLVFCVGCGRWAVRVVSWLSHNNYRCQDALGTAGALRLLLTQLTIALSAAQPPAAEEGKEKGRGSGQWVVALEEPLDGKAKAVAEVLQALANLSFKHYANQVGGVCTYVVRPKPSCR
jgi:predicted Fe-S protein YdhL (DUF1289 family)